MSAGFALLKRFVRETSGYAVDDDRRYLVEDRLAPILRDANLSCLDDLARALYDGRHPELRRTVVEALTINETSFFRDKAFFNAFADSLLPQLIEARKHERRLRIWSAGCSTGQEPYSVAMIIDEHMRRLGGWQIEILATDLSRAVLETACRGRYSQFEVQRGLPVALLVRHFTRQGETWQISDYLRAKVSFRAQNLMSIEPGIGLFDIILCRNVLIHFGADAKKRVFAGLAAALRDDGRLVLGVAERIAGATSALLPDPQAPFVFKAPKAPLVA